MVTKKIYIHPLLNKSDKILMSLCSLFSGASLFLFFVINPKIDSAVIRPIAILKGIKENVKYKSSESFSFYNVTKDLKLQNNDFIFTGENSKVVIQFIGSKNSIVVSQNSLIQISDDESSGPNEDGTTNLITVVKGLVLIKNNNEGKMLVGDKMNSETSEVNDKIFVLGAEDLNKKKN